MLHRFISAISMVLSLLLLLSGCAATNLNKLAVISIAVVTPQGTGIAPGEKSSLLVSMTKADGKVLTTERTDEGRIGWNDLKIDASVVVADTKGRISLPQDPRVSYGKLPHVSITVPSHPDLRADLDIPLRYDRKFTAYFQGSTGFSGTDGTNGMDGSSGTSGSIDFEHPSPGGDGSDGTDGSDGGSGDAGGDGPPVRILVAVKPGIHPLLQVSVSAEGREKFFLVDPQGGSLEVSSAGGEGGAGGHGGRGGHGGSGGIGSPNGRSGRDGLNGHDGSSGLSGSGGSITVTYDPQARPFLGTIRLSNPGGPRPVFQEQTVAALW